VSVWRTVRRMLAAHMFLPGATGDAGTYQTVAKMQQMARADASKPTVRAIAASIVEGAADQNGTLHARLIRMWLESHTIFTRDPSTGEALYTPEDTAQEIQRNKVAHVDCEDVAMLAAALGMAVGLVARYVLLAFAANAPFQHVYTDLADPRQRVWVEQDITRPAQWFFGKMVARKKIVGV
jgi:transglutaminase-like putative cysteine protease